MNKELRKLSIKQKLAMIIEVCLVTNQDLHPLSSCPPFFSQKKLLLSVNYLLRFLRSGFKTPSKARWLRCRPPINAHIPHVCCAFSIRLRLALEPDLGF